MANQFINMQDTWTKITIQLTKKVVCEPHGFRYKPKPGDLGVIIQRHTKGAISARMNNDPDGWSWGLQRQEFKIIKKEKFPYGLQADGKTFVGRINF